MPPPNPYPSLCSSATPRRTTPSLPISTQPSSTSAAMAALQPTLSFKPSTNMLTSGFAPRGHILNRLIDLYCKASYFRYAKKLFDEIPEPDVVARTTLIAAYSASGDPKLAREVFDGIPLEIRDIVFNDMRRNADRNKNGAMAMGGSKQIPMSDPPCMGARGEAICKYNCMRRHGPDVQAYCLSKISCQCIWLDQIVPTTN
ncbi:hypothetical protein OROHE_005524 [Orobanche hederae]